MKKQPFGIFFLILGLTALTPAGAQSSAKIWVTKNFVQEAVVDEDANVKDQNVMDLLREHSSVKTAFAGGFVTEINGIPAKPESQQNWFYYVNGIFSRIGALVYFPQDGDILWWDYHRWDNAAYVSAVIGAYPHPFIGGYQGVVPKTKVVGTPSIQDKAQGLVETLKHQGVKDVEFVSYAGNIESLQNDYVILLGTWEEIKNDKTIMDLFKNHRKTGVFVRFGKDKVTSLDILGEEVHSYERASCILALAGGFQENLPIWLVTGTDEQSLNHALDLFMKTPEKMKYYAGMLVTDKEIIHVPVIDEKK